MTIGYIIRYSQAGEPFRVSLHILVSCPEEAKLCTLVSVAPEKISSSSI